MSNDNLPRAKMQGKEEPRDFVYWGKANRNLMKTYILVYIL
jgi:hypothetical protein